MKYLKLAFIGSAFAAAAFLSGCAGYDTNYKGAGVSAEPSHNIVLGIVKTYPKSYRYVDSSNSLILRTDEIWGRRNFSGTDVSLFWDLVNICDY